MRSSNNCGGMGVGWGWASGAKQRKSCQWKWERVSPIELVTPGICWAENEKLWRMAGSSKAFSRYTRHGTLEVHSGCGPRYRLSKTEHAACTTDGPRHGQRWPLDIVSYTRWTALTARTSMNQKKHFPATQVPKPREPAVSEETSASVAGVFPAKSQKLTACYSIRNWSHHSLLRRIGWSFFRKQHSRSIIQYKNVRLGQKTFAAWSMPRAPVCCATSGPTTMQLTPSRPQASKLGGEPPDWQNSSSMPRIVSTGAGPTHLPGWRGKPSWSHIAKAVLRFLSHWVKPGGPAVIKSSRCAVNLQPHESAPGSNWPCLQLH